MSLYDLCRLSSVLKRSKTVKIVNSSYFDIVTYLSSSKDKMAEAATFTKTPKSSVIIMPPEGTNGWTQIQAIREKHDKSYVRWMPHINMLYPFMADVNEGRDFQEAADKLTEALKDVKPIRVKFSRDSFGYFNHGKSFTLWLKPLAQDAVAEVETECTPQNKPQPEDTSASNEQETNADQPDQKKARKGKPQKKKFIPTSLPNQQEVVDLQTRLFEAFPACDDLTKISDKGFQPHLSVGQFKQHNIDEHALKFYEDWEDFEFDVKEVFLISRADFHDPFHVRHAVRLGGSS